MTSTTALPLSPTTHRAAILRVIVVIVTVLALCITAAGISRAIAGASVPCTTSSTNLGSLPMVDASGAYVTGNSSCMPSATPVNAGSSESDLSGQVALALATAFTH